MAVSVLNLQFADAASSTVLNDFRHSPDAPPETGVVVAVQRKQTAGLTQYFCGLVAGNSTADPVRGYTKKQMVEHFGFSSDIPGDDDGLFGPFDQRQADAFLQMAEQMAGVNYFAHRANAAEESLLTLTRK